MIAILALLQVAIYSTNHKNQPGILKPGVALMIRAAMLHRYADQ
jgi:hypothetical protein